MAINQPKTIFAYENILIRIPSIIQISRKLVLPTVCGIEAQVIPVWLIFGVQMRFHFVTIYSAECLS